MSNAKGGIGCFGMIMICALISVAVDWVTSQYQAAVAPDRPPAQLQLETSILEVQDQYKVEAGEAEDRGNRVAENKAEQDVKTWRKANLMTARTVEDWTCEVQAVQTDYDILCRTVSADATSDTERRIQYSLEGDLGSVSTTASAGDHLIFSGELSPETSWLTENITVVADFDVKVTAVRLEAP